MVFSVVDIIAALTDSENPRNYWNMMKAREQKDSEIQLSTFCVQLKLPSADGKSYTTDCVNTESASFNLSPARRPSHSSNGLRRLVTSAFRRLKNPELAHCSAIIPSFANGCNKLTNRVLFGRWFVIGFSAG